MACCSGGRYELRQVIRQRRELVDRRRQEDEVFYGGGFRSDMILEKGLEQQRYACLACIELRRRSSAEPQAKAA